MRIRPAAGDGASFTATAKYRNSLSRIAKSKRIEGRADLKHCFEIFLRVRQPQIIDLVDAYTVLARYRASRINADTHHLQSGVLHSLYSHRIARIERYERMQVPVASVKHIRDGKLVF